MEYNPPLDKSLKFAARIVKLYQYLTKEKKESIISKQIIRMSSFPFATHSNKHNVLSIAHDIVLFVYGAECRLYVFYTIHYSFL